MRRAHLRDAVLQQRFWFRKHMARARGERLSPTLPGPSSHTLPRTFPQAPPEEPVDDPDACEVRACARASAQCPSPTSTVPKPFPYLHSTQTLSLPPQYPNPSPTSARQAAPGASPHAASSLGAQEMSVLEILTGKGDHFPGLIPLIFAYLEASHSSARFLAISWPSLGPLSAVSLHLSATSRPSRGRETQTFGHLSSLPTPTGNPVRPRDSRAHAQLHGPPPAPRPLALVGCRVLAPRAYPRVPEIRRRASGQLATAARWMRARVAAHPSYRGDSRVPDDVAYDLVKVRSTHMPRARGRAHGPSRSGQADRPTRVRRQHWVPGGEAHTSTRTRANT